MADSDDRPELCLQQPRTCRRNCGQHAQFYQAALPRGRGSKPRERNTAGFLNYGLSNMDINEFLQYITGLPDYEGQIEHVQYLPSSEPVFADLKQPLHPSLESALRAQGVQRFFSH